MSNRVDQNHILDLFQKNSSPAAIYLRNGAMLMGRIQGHDIYTVLLETDKCQVLIYKHAITGVMHPRRKVG